MKNDFTPRDDAFCDICTAPINQKALHCSKCKFNVCPICYEKKQGKKWRYRKLDMDWFFMSIFFIHFWFNTGVYYLIRSNNIREKRISNEF